MMSFSPGCLESSKQTLLVMSRNPLCPTSLTFEKEMGLEAFDASPCMSKASDMSLLMDLTTFEKEVCCLGLFLPCHTCKIPKNGFNPFRFCTRNFYLASSA
jgi:hypothetical protein